jgi:hypothetical protein
MVMLTEVTEQSVRPPRAVDRSIVWARTERPVASGSRLAPDRPAAGVRQLLSEDPREFVARQWQPFGE